MLEALLALLAGLLIGSFLNVCIYRLPRDLSVVRPRSFCPTCEQPISWFDNIPILSYILLHGRCRNCDSPISMRYPIVEALTAISFFTSVYFLGPNLNAVKLCVFCAIIITLVFSDLEERILPDEFTIGGTLLGIVIAVFVPFNGGIMHLIFPNLAPWILSVLEAAFAAGFTSGSIWLVGEIYYRLRKREGLGFGDVKMVAMIGAFLGLQGALLTLILGSMLGGIGGLLYIFVTGKNASTYELPFGTFLGTAALGVAVFGEGVLQWYMQMGS